jgi:hypothetical protein
LGQQILADRVKRQAFRQIAQHNVVAYGGPVGVNLALR